MKKLILFYIIIFIKIIYPQIPNAGFEEGVTNWAGSGSLIIAVDTSKFYDGTQSLDCTINSDAANGDLRSEVIHGIQENTDYTLSVWFYDNDPAGRGRPVIEWLDNSDTHISNTFAGTYTSDQMNWQQITINAASPANAAGCKVGCRFYDNPGSWDGDCTIYVDLFGGSPAPLPVDLVSFKAYLVKNKVELNWQTATEVNNYGFEVQRRSPESQDWAVLGFVRGNGNSNSPKYYSFPDNTLSVAGKYLYRLKQMDTEGSFKYSPITEAEYSPPLTYGLAQNYPNPFNPSTKISFAVPVESFVSVIIYNVLGNQAAVLFNGTASAGKTYDLLFDGSSLASGVYFSVMHYGVKTEIKKMMLIR